MAKITFTKLNLPKVNKEEKIIKIGDAEVAVKQFLSTDEKLELIESILTKAVDETYGYFNPIRIDFITTIELINAYTNVTFTEKQIGDNLFKTMDTLDAAGATDAIIDAIPKSEYDSIIKTIESCSVAIERFNCSLAGMLSRVRSDNDAIALDAEKIATGLSPENLEYVKQILENV